MGRLPSGYQELEYIQSMGSQRIKTSYIPVSTDEIEITVIPTTTTQACFWCARGVDTNTNTYTCFNISSQFRFDCATSGIGLVQGGSIVANNQYTINAKNGVLKVNDTTIGSGTISSFTAGNSVELLAAYTGGLDNNVANYMSAKFKGFFAKSSSGDYKINLVPCKRLSDSVLGVYDLVGNNFIAGTGTFIAGTPVLDPIVPTWGSGLASVNKSAIIRRRGLIGADKILKLYWDGDECTDVTGGWSGFGYRLSTRTDWGKVTPTVTKNADNMYAVLGNGGSHVQGAIFTGNKIDVSGYSFLCITLVANQPNTGNYYWGSTSIGLTTQKKDLYNFAKSAEITRQNTRYSSPITYFSGTKKLDISSINDLEYVAFQMSNNTASNNARITRIWLE